MECVSPHWLLNYKINKMLSILLFTDLAWHCGNFLILSLFSFCCQSLVTVMHGVFWMPIWSSSWSNSTICAASNINWGSTFTCCRIYPNDWHWLSGHQSTWYSLYLSVVSMLCLFNVYPTFNSYDYNVTTAKVDALQSFHIWTDYDWIV